MPRRDYDDWIHAKEISTMGQELATQQPSYKDYMGADVALARRIARLNVLIKAGMVEETPEIKMVRSMLVEQNRATFASSERTDNLTKISLGLGKEEVPPADGSQ